MDIYMNTKVILFSFSLFCRIVVTLRHPTLYGRFRIALIELTCPWDTDAKRAEERKTARYAELKEELSNQGWDCSLYLIEVGAQGDIVKSVKDCLRSLFRAWVPAGYRSGIRQMMKDVSRISLVCSFAIF
jgi:hypothetical protein